MPRLTTAIDPKSDAFVRNVATNTVLAETLRLRVAEAALGARQVGRQRMGEGEDVWEDVIFTLATDAPAAFRRG